MCRTQPPLQLHSTQPRGLWPMKMPGISCDNVLYMYSRKKTFSASLPVSVWISYFILIHLSEVCHQYVYVSRKKSFEGVFTVCVILNELMLQADSGQQKEGHSVVYTYSGSYLLWGGNQNLHTNTFFLSFSLSPQTLNMVICPRLWLCAILSVLSRALGFSRPLVMLGSDITSYMTVQRLICL